MLDFALYRASESLAISSLDSWRQREMHYVDHFENTGFPVRVNNVSELGQILDTMQENRFDKYMSELGGVSPEEFKQLIDACKNFLSFLRTNFPNRQPFVPLSTMLSAAAVHFRLRAYNPNYSSLLEIGPGCGYVSFFLSNHGAMENYSQIEACESFYLLQNLINVHVFRSKFLDFAYPDGKNADCFVSSSPNFEDLSLLDLPSEPERCRHYPWWKIGQLASGGAVFDAVTSNANLLEFKPQARADYISLIKQVLKSDGVFYVQCTGFNAHGNVEDLFSQLYESGFAPLFSVQEGVPVEFENNASTGLLKSLTRNKTTNITFTVRTLVLVKESHPLFKKYHHRKNFNHPFLAQEEQVKQMILTRAKDRKVYSREDIIGEILSAKSSEV
jgi:SAM-dependent methyltransferase